jgi:UDP:flavonoid glycosyltransferase YjiC (YdhE family)
VYVTQGSTGDPDLLRLAVAELAAEPVEVLVTTGGLCEPAELERLGPAITAAPLLPGDACLERADAAVIHGGHLTFCETLRSGTPFVVLPYRRDQIARVNRAERLGVGVGVWPRPLRRGVVRRAVRRVLEQSRYRSRCEELGRELREQWDGTRNAADLLERELLDGG